MAWASLRKARRYSTVFLLGCRTNNHIAIGADKPTPREITRTVTTALRSKAVACSGDIWRANIRQTRREPRMIDQNRSLDRNITGSDKGLHCASNSLGDRPLSSSAFGDDVCMEGMTALD